MFNQTITYSEATDSDIADIVNLVNLAYRSNEHRGWTSEAGMISGDRINEQQVMDLLTLDSSLLLMKDDQELLGCVHVKNNKTSCYIGLLTTHPKYQNVGLGKKLLELAEKHAIEKYKKTVFEMTVLSTRLELIAFYERRGYQFTGQIKAYPTNANIGQPLSSRLQVMHLKKFLSAKISVADLKK